MTHPTVPTRSPALVEQEELNTKLNAEIQVIESELKRLKQAQGSASQDQNIDAAAERLIQGDCDVSQCWQPPLEQAEELTARRRVVARAIEKLGPALAQGREEHARATAGVWRPAHRAAVAKIAEALVMLMNANKTELEIRGQFPGNYLPAMNLVGLGSFGAGGGLGQQWKDYARANNYWPENL